MPQTEYNTTVTRIDTGSETDHRYNIKVECLTTETNETDTDSRDYGTGGRGKLTDTQLINRVRYLTEEAYDTHKEMAESVGVARSTVSNWAAGNRTPSKSNRQKVNRRFRYHYSEKSTGETEEVIVKDEWPVSEGEQGPTIGSHPVEPKSAWEWSNPHFNSYASHITNLYEEMMEVQNDTPRLQIQVLWTLTYRAVDDQGREVIPQDLRFSPARLENHNEASDDARQHVERQLSGGPSNTVPVSYYATMSAGEWMDDWSNWYQYLRDCKESPHGSEFRPVPRYYTITLFTSKKLNKEDVQTIEQNGTTTTQK